ncbi:uncharacterized protein B0H18DRAFT_1106961 [Fomitopsis serialis]|uniref:uncharacterized protein n=1 Tax=Fomitopsis serialis TaxID=139415 RepID=UPI002008381A|nr:uncharacterized protein B0H18DRAFT_1106961 [Neoantrodia serialis]KAH9918308.1 hypothetical protein B0H18DRAFT_1106961 [Neoantrodia serialis]
MRYTALSSAVLLAVATAPALAHPVTTRATEDASIVERKLQNGLVKYGHYDDLVSRNLEARWTVDPEEEKRRAGEVLAQRRRTQAEARQARAQAHAQWKAHEDTKYRLLCNALAAHTQNRLQSQAGPSRSPHTPPNRSRSDEDASMIERELQDGLVERGYYDDLLARDLEARNNAEPETAEQRAARERQERESRWHQGQGRGHSAGTSNGPVQQPSLRPGPRQSPWRPWAHRQASSHPRSRRSFLEDALDGGLFTRTIEDASMVERELQDGLVERGDKLKAAKGRSPKEAALKWHSQVVAKGMGMLIEAKKKQAEPSPPQGGSRQNNGAGRGREPITVAGRNVKTQSPNIPSSKNGAWPGGRVCSAISAQRSGVVHPYR